MLRAMLTQKLNGYDADAPFPVWTQSHINNVRMGESKVYERIVMEENNGITQFVFEPMYEECGEITTEQNSDSVHEIEPHLALRFSICQYYRDASNLRYK